MRNPLAQATKATGILENFFSYMLPWDSIMRKLSKAWQDGDFTDWPLDAPTCFESVQMQIVHGHEVLIDRARPLTVRSQIVKEMANMYIDNNSGGPLKLKKKKRISVEAARHS